VGLILRPIAGSSLPFFSIVICGPRAQDQLH
jgi:hypothetical protein